MKPSTSFMRDAAGASSAEYALILAIIGGAIAFGAIELAESVSGSMYSSAEIIAERDTPGKSGSAPDQTGETPGQSGAPPPGKSGSAPGQTGETPGQSGTTPPGQSGAPPPGL